MGCFLGCFGSKQDRKWQTQRYRVINRDQQRHVNQNVLQATVSQEQVIIENPQSPVALSVKHEEQSLSNRKKVTFDSNVKTYEHIQVNESTESLIEKEKEENFPPVAQSQSQMLSRSNSEDDSVNSSVGSYPPNHRYQNCQESDDEVEDSDYVDSDFDDQDDNYEDEGDCGDDYEASMETFGRYARDRSENVHPVLNPVENLSQWKAAKVKRAFLPSNPQKENFSFNLQTPPKPQKNQEIAVDTSLSNWLTSTEEKISSSEKSLSQESTATSLRSLEDRPILGVLTVEELRQNSASSSARKSPRRSPEDMPLIGSVGSYWSHSSLDEDSGSVSSFKGRQMQLASTERYVPNEILRVGYAKFDCLGV